MSSAKMLSLESEDHDRVSFDVDGFKAERAAASAATRRKTPSTKWKIRASRSTLRRCLRASGGCCTCSCWTPACKTASSGEGPRRHVVLYPEGYRIPEERPSFGRGRSNDRSRGPVVVAAIAAAAAVADATSFHLLSALRNQQNLPDSTFFSDAVRFRRVR